MSAPQAGDDEARKREVEAARQRVLLSLLDVQARQRLTNIRLVKPELAAAVENYLISAASSGRLNRPLTDEELKQILLSIQQPKRDFKIDRR
ncbi:MAG: DNA-binding protein [Nitrososphaera sp.]|uniref:DNA-binding protein n=1 Tax=Nitrososphaera sp. TaxID=1971748 RepID=UPI0017F777B9|nr:DNA-binding protein [Nitrososphaera sp.]NWG37546.1 DNA-binding protein [Nitrososphaera sp.]